MLNRILPKCWQELSLGDVAEYINGRAFKPREWKKKGLPIIRIQNLNDPSKEFNCFDGEYEQKHYIDNGDILISWSASLGIYVWEKGPALLNQHIFKVLPKESIIDRRYLVYAVQTILQQMKSRVHGSTMKHIVKGDFLTLKIPVPPLYIQKKIADVLDRAKQLQQIRDQANALAEKTVQSTFLKMFGDPIINRVGWKIDIIDNLTSIKATKGSTPTTYGYAWENEGVLFLRSECITSGGISLTGSMNIGKDAHEFMQRSKVYPGDILIRITGEVGIAAIFPKELQEANINQHIAIVRLREDSHIEPVFLAAQINVKPFRSHYSSITRGVTHPHLSLQQIRETRVIIPPQDLQKKFVSIYSNIESIKEKHKESGIQINCLFNSLMVKAFRGELTQGEVETSKPNKPLIQGSLNPQ
jgi:type I restriction enzyme S subunit